MSPSLDLAPAGGPLVSRRAELLQLLRSDFPSERVPGGGTDPRLPGQDYVIYEGIAKLRRQLRGLLWAIDDPTTTEFSYVYGPTGSGKSAFVRSAFPSWAYDKYYVGGQQKRHIIWVDCPAGSPSALQDRILSALGLPVRGQPGQKYAAMKHQIERQETVLLILDDAQQVTNTREFRFADWVKDLANTLRCRVLLIGLYGLRDILGSNNQLAHRLYPTISLRPLDWFSEADRKNYRGILATTQKDCGNLFHPSLNLRNEALAAALNIHSRGLVGQTMRFLKNAHSHARHLEKRAYITFDDLVAVMDTFIANSPYNAEAKNYLTSELPVHWEPASIDFGAEAGSGKKNNK